MGLFGPTKKGGGLDMRFKSNRGGYMGKASRMASDLAFLTSSTPEIVDLDAEEKAKKIESDSMAMLYAITTTEIPTDKDELHDYLMVVSNYLTDDGVKEFKSDLRKDIKDVAQWQFNEACKNMKEVSPKEAVFFENRLKKAEKQDRNRILMIVLVFVVLAVAYAIMFATGFLEL